MVFQTITTNRLILRILTPKVHDFVNLHYSDAEMKTFFGFTTDAELEKERDKYEKGIVTYNKSFLNFQLINKETHEVMGECGFHTWFPKHRRAEIGYSLGKEEWKRQGFMSEALIPILEYGFTKMNLHRVEALVEPDNVPSLKLMEKFGFKKEGILREHYYIFEKMHNSIMFGLLQTEYLAQLIV